MSKVNAMLDKYRNASSVAMRVGIMGGKTYPDGKTVAQVGFDNEYGVPHRRVPARPFFRTTIENNRGVLPSMAASLLKKHDVETALRLMGEHMSDELQESVMTWQEPPNRPSTIAAKGYNAPLRANDRLLRNSFSYEIEE